MTVNQIDIFQRIATLEAEVKYTRQEVHDLSIKLAYYDKVALKWGGFAMGAMTLGAVMAAGVDKVKEKIIAWFL